MSNGWTLPSFAQEFILPKPGVMVQLSPSFNPPILKGIKVHPNDPFRFDFILDKGDSELSNDQLKDESSRLIKYFLASLTIPEKDLWVNLSPYEKDRIIPQSFGLTEMGRDLLAEDYMLKQITASLIYPEGETGKRFWARVYAEAAKKFGTTNIPVNTFNKVWIVPGKAVVYENAKAKTAYIVESKLKVMLEQDYLSLSRHSERSEESQKRDPSALGLKDNVNKLGSQIIREIIIPELSKEINTGKNFAKLRQVYNSLILALWYKKKIRDSIFSLTYNNRNKTTGVNIDNPKEKQNIYARYLQAFKKGTCNYIKEELDPLSRKLTPRKYFSGGAFFGQVSWEATDDAAMITPTPRGTYIEKVEIDPAVTAPIPPAVLANYESFMSQRGIVFKRQFGENGIFHQLAWGGAIEYLDEERESGRLVPDWQAKEPELGRLSATWDEDEYFKYMIKPILVQSQLSGPPLTRPQSEKDQKILLTSREWFPQLPLEYRDQLFRFLAHRVDFLSKSDDARAWFYEQKWFKLLARSILYWLQQDLVSKEAIKDVVSDFERPKRVYYYLNGEMTAAHIALGMKAWEGLDPKSEQAHRIVASVQKTLIYCQLKDLRAAYDYLSIYFQREWVPFMEILRSDSWLTESVDLWEKEMGWVSRAGDLSNVRTDVPIYFSMPYLSDGIGDAKLAWRMLLDLRRRYTGNPIVLMTESQTVDRWFTKIDPEIHKNLPDQIVKGIRLITYTTKPHDFGTVKVVSKADFFEEINRRIAQSNDYIFINFLNIPGYLHLIASETAPERTINIADFDNNNLGSTTGTMLYDILQTGFMPGSIGMGFDNGKSLNGRALLTKQEMVDRLDLAHLRSHILLEQCPWAATYIHSRKGMENYINHLRQYATVNAARLEGKPIVLFQLGGHNHSYWHRFEGPEPNQIPGVGVISYYYGSKGMEVFDNFFGQGLDNAKQVLVIEMPGLEEGLFHELLETVDFAPKIRGGDTMSYLFTHSVPFVLENELTFIESSWDVLSARAHDLGLNLWPEEALEGGYKRFREHNTDVMARILQSRPWDMSNGLTVYTDYLLLGKNMPHLSLKNDRAMTVYGPTGRRDLAMKGKISLIAPDVPKPEKTGGIDLSAGKSSLEINNSGTEIKFHIDPAMLAQLRNAPGFVPVIINIKPMSDLRGFLEGVNR